ncbi:MAG: hypothetical protein NTV46_08795 [Verrucomicrobia bacterium]|nr:hypothetical protein [Verrucomicrobiota bacterium]
MIARFPCLLLIPTLMMAHPDHGAVPGAEVNAAVTTGNGEWTYEAVPGWGVLPDGKQIGPTHGSVLVGPDRNIYLSTDSEMSIIVWEPDGRFVKTIAPECQGFHAMQLREEGGRTVIYGAQNNGNGNSVRQTKGLPPTPFRVCKIDLDGKILMEIPNAATGGVTGGWNGLTAVTVAPDGAVFAAMGYGSQLIHKFDATGRLLKTFGRKGNGDGQFNTCHGLTIDTRFGAPRLLVADRENRRLCHLDLEGNWIGVHASNLRRPCSFSWRGGNLAVAELEARVVILDKTGTPVAFLGDNPDRTQWANFGVPPEQQHLGIFTAPHGIAFAENGDLYVQDWNQTGRVTKLRKK